MDGTSEENRFAPPRSVVADIGVAGVETLPAGRWRRFFGFFIDGIVIAIAFWILALVTPWNLIARVAGNNSNFFGVAWLTQVIGFALFMAINGYLLATRAQTVAKVMLGMRIVRTDGSQVTFGRQIVRVGTGYFFSIVPLLGFVYALIDGLLIFRSNRRCLHDEIVGTMVVRV